MRWAKLAMAVAATGAMSVTALLLSSENASAAFNDTDGDGAIDTIEHLASSDPFDADSTPENAAGPAYLGRPVCTDGVDNDLDGQTDEADPGCTDSDGDLVDDPTELAIGSDPNDFDSIPEDSRVDAILSTFGFVTFQCTNDLDDDHDGLIDAADPGCAPFDSDDDGYGDVEEKTYGSDPNNMESAPEDDRVSPALCADGLDNDGDGLTDMEDSGCLPHPTATPTSTPEAQAGTPIPTATGTHLAPQLPATGLQPSGTAAPSVTWSVLAVAAVGSLAGVAFSAAKRGERNL
jgi:hypothetical protein